MTEPFTEPTTPQPIQIVVFSHETASLTQNGQTTNLVGPGQTIRSVVVTALRDHAAHQGYPVAALIDDRTEQAVYQMVVAPDGSIQQAVALQSPPSPSAAPSGPIDSTNGAHGLADQPDTAPNPLLAPVARRVAGSLLTSAPAPRPARHGLRGSLNNLGLRLKPGAAEVAIRHDTEAIAAFGAAGHCIMIANGKGGSNKTPTTALISAVVARLLGLGVVAVDFNESDGTLGWRTSPDPAQAGATLVDLLPNAHDLMGSDAHAGRLASYFHHHAQDRYDVLWSDQNTASNHLLTGDEVDVLYNLLVHYYRTVVIDTGNNVRSDNWRAAAAHADMLVLAVTGQEDSAEAAARLLDRMHNRDEHSQRLAANAVAIVSVRNSEKIESERIDRIIAELRGETTGQPLVADTVKIPFDPALRAGYIMFDALRPATQAAWIHAVATIARRIPPSSDGGIGLT